MNNENLNLFTQFLLNTLNQKEYELREINPLNPELSPIHVFLFKNYPAPELTTFVTYGLSEVTHPKWHAGRPELLLSVESKKEAWGIALAAIVIQFRGEKVFSYGSTYMMDEAISPTESKMSGFVIFKPSFVEPEKGIFQFPEKTVYLSQAYPIYEGEAKLIEKKGFEGFWENKDFEDPYDVGRKDISKRNKKI